MNRPIRSRLTAAWRHPDLALLAVVLLVGAVPRLGLLLRAPAFITNDSLSYLLPGFDLVMGAGFEPIYKRPPGYPAFVGGALWFFGQQDLVGLLALQHILGLVMVAEAYVVGRLLFGRLAALVAGLLTALSGPLIVTEQYVMSETLFGVLLGAAIIAVLLGLRGRRLTTLALGAVLLGLAALTRPIAQLLVPYVVLLSLTAWPRWRPAAMAALVVVTCYAGTVLPWMVRNGLAQGSFTLAGGLGEGLAVRTIRLDQDFEFNGPPGGAGRLREELRIYREEAEEDSMYEMAHRLRTELDLTPAQADRAMRDIALGAIVQKPGYYVVGSLEMFGRMFAGRPVRLRQDWQPWRGIRWEERVEHLMPGATVTQQQAFREAEALVSIYDPAHWWPLLTAFFGLGCAAALRSAARLRALLPAVATVSLLLASAFLVGIEWRYRYPLDPLINATVGGGLSLVSHGVRGWLAARLAIHPRSASSPVFRH